MINLFILFCNVYFAESLEERIHVYAKRQRIEVIETDDNCT